MKTDRERTECVCLMNMCIIENGEGQILLLDKVTGHYRGKTFPGGHIEEGEVFQEAMIREVKEETGLDIIHPMLCGVYHWRKKDIHNIIFAYKATEFHGELRASREGSLQWMEKEELKNLELATGSKYILELSENNEIRECVMTAIDGVYHGRLY